MHFEILVEDQSGRMALDALVPRIVGESHSFRIKTYKGIGRIPKGMRNPKDASKRILLDNLPRLLRGFGKAFPEGQGQQAAAIVVCDLDHRCLREFRQELHAILTACRPRPVTRFCIAVEEGEAWLLGDPPAVKAAYPKAKAQVLNHYVNDSICGTWETLADAVHQGGAKALSAKGWQAVGTERSRWAQAICPHMTAESNRSPSFQYFRSKLLQLATPPAKQ